MRDRTATRIAWTLFALCVVLAAWSLVVATLRVGGIPDWAILLVGFLAAPAVGALIASRQPANAVGWLLLAAGLSLGVAAVTDGYVQHAATTRSEWTGELAALYFAANTAYFGLITIGGVGVPLVFPDGRPLGPRWRLALHAAALGLPLVAIGVALESGELAAYGIESPNPFGLDEAPWLPQAFAGSGLMLIAAGAAAAVLSVVLRLRRATGEERQQLKWFAFAACLAVVSLAASFFAWALLGWEDAVFDVALSTLLLIAMPVSIGIAILRHRLYDIDLLIRRSLVYGTLTVATASSYLLLVVGLGWAVRAVAGQGANELAVAATTLLVAALFQPARRRIQSFVDRRFYRSRYDAARTLAAFQSRLRDGTDLEALRGDLLAVVGETLQPTRAWVWLRQPGERR
jgi:hypothetical protein